MVLQSDINQIDTLIHLSSGKLAFLHTQDSLVPIIGKLDSNNTWNWAVELSPSDSTSWVPLKAMSGSKLETRNGANEIHFFNDTFYEPGVIFLNSDETFNYMCLSPM